ncbi:MAG: DUF928 domain-containing protein [Cyanothece sp. SIO2G6]|nr:DUF928 domain-containing protein [Cyanothece sp. SIO2G6]
MTVRAPSFFLLRLAIAIYIQAGNSKMMRHTQFNYTALTTVGLASLLINVLSFAGSSAYAQSDNTNHGLPPGTVAGGSRGATTCSIQAPVVAFMPETNLLQTLDTQPSLWVYLPESLPLQDAELVLYDETETAVIDTVFSIADQSGLVKIDLAAIANVSPLKADQRYRWFLSLICPDNRAADISVDGWLHLTPLSATLAEQLDRTSDPVEQANLYITAGMWSEAIATLVDWQESSSTTIAPEAWEGVIEALNPGSVPLNLATADQLTLDAN